MLLRKGRFSPKVDTAFFAFFQQHLCAHLTFFHNQQSTLFGPLLVRIAYSLHFNRLDSSSHTAITSSTQKKKKTLGVGVNRSWLFYFVCLFKPTPLPRTLVQRWGKDVVI